MLASGSAQLPQSLIASKSSEPRAPVYYRNCDAARAAGAAPLTLHEPGYRRELDRDRDGIACEPYYGR